MISAKENLTEKYRHLLKAVHRYDNLLVVYVDQKMSDIYCSYDEESVRDQVPTQFLLADCFFVRFQNGF